jgi:predicted ferric reductase
VGLTILARPAGKPLTIRSSIGPRSNALLALTGAILVVTVWWRGATPAVGPGAELTDASRLTGLLAGYVALLQVLLRTRLSVIERGLGTDAINTWHHLLGGYLITLVVAHATLITAGYAAGSHVTLLAQIRAWLTEHPYVWWAVIAVGLLLGIAATSAQRVRRRLRYEVWHGLHLAVY